jgi:hypothetical protein
MMKAMITIFNEVKCEEYEHEFDYDVEHFKTNDFRREAEKQMCDDIAINKPDWNVEDCKYYLEIDRCSDRFVIAVCETIYDVTEQLEIEAEGRYDLSKFNIVAYVDDQSIDTEVETLEEIDNFVKKEVVRINAFDIFGNLSGIYYTDSLDIVKIK